MIDETLFNLNKATGRHGSDKRLEFLLSGEHDTYAILQLQSGAAARDERFMSYRYLERQGKEPNFDHYEVVYLGLLDATPERERNEILDHLYNMFNFMHPEDFCGHSMSVSDVVGLCIDSKTSFILLIPLGLKSLKTLCLRFT